MKIYGTKLNPKQFNDKYQVGTKIKYHPIITKPEYREGITTHEAFMHYGNPVIFIDCVRGFVSLDSVEVQE